MHDFGIFQLAGFRGSPTSMRSDPSRRTTFGISLVSSVCPILSADQSNPWWLHQIQVPLDGTIRDLGDQRHVAFMRQMERRRLRRHHFKSEFLFQLWFNSIGPGGRTWFGNRYVTIRHYTFRLRWRP